MESLVIVFAKAPQEGRVKTRLARTMGEGAAAAAYRRLAEESLRQIPQSAEVWVAFSPRGQEREIREWLGAIRPVGHWLPQSDGSLGDRLDAACREGLRAGNKRVLVVGTDCVELSSDIWDEVHCQLTADTDAVFVPASDGGYVLLGIRNERALNVFHGVRWSSAETLSDSIAAAKKSGLSVKVLDILLSDVDIEADWIRAKRVLDTRDTIRKTLSMENTFSEPITFHPVLMERVWGGRKLESFGKTLPKSAVPYGESWEMVDREEVQSVVDHGNLEGTPLSELWKTHRESVFGISAPASKRFPILIKILDCQDRLSVQVHPPAEKAKTLGGEPKTEMWYLVDAERDASLYVGLRSGVTRECFTRAVAEGTAEDLVHKIMPVAGESIFIPSGRLHAIGGGLVIYEIQQNSDTTYRVFDWNRTGLDGKPRQLHIEESLQCIDFSDSEPSMDIRQGEEIATCEHFRVDHWNLSRGAEREAAEAGECAVFGVVSGEISCGGRHFSKGDFFLVPASRTPGCGLLKSELGEANVIRTRFSSRSDSARGNDGMA